MSFSQKIDEYISIKNLTLSQLIGKLQIDVYAIGFVLLALPSALPVPAPGYSMPFGIILLVLSLQMLFRIRTPWIPKWAANRSISLNTDSKIYTGALSFLGFFERYIHVRFARLSKLLYIPAIAIVILCSLSMMIIIPGTNTVPAIAIFCIGVGLLERDGLFLLGGVLVGMVGICISLGILFFGVEFLRMALELIS